MLICDGTQNNVTVFFLSPLNNAILYCTEQYGIGILIRNENTEGKPTGLITVAYVISK